MRLPLRLGLLLGFVLVANLPASTVLSCGSASGKATPTLLPDTGGCYSLLNFNTTETVNWNTTFGTNVYVGATNIGAQWDAPTGVAWTPPPTTVAGGLGLTASLFLQQTGSIFRYDNSAVNNTNLRTYNGMFGEGDNLLGIPNGALELHFNKGISGALFRISNPNSSTSMTATITAYGEANPSNQSTAIGTYSIGLNCSVGGNCDTATPYLGIETGMLNVHSLVISSSGGFYIDTLFVDEVPEPGTFTLTGMVGLLAILGRRRMLRDRRP